MRLRLWRWMAGAIALPAAVIILVQVMSDVASIAVCLPGAECAPYATMRFWVQMAAGVGIALLLAALVAGAVLRSRDGPRELPVDRRRFSWALSLGGGAVVLMTISISAADLAGPWRPWGAPGDGVLRRLAGRLTLPSDESGTNRTGALWTGPCVLPYTFPSAPLQAGDKPVRNPKVRLGARTPRGFEE